MTKHIVKPRKTKTLTNIPAMPSSGPVMLETFANNLRRARVKAGLSQSDLARKIWGSTKNSDGHSVARNRDRISSYEAGHGEPTPQNLTMIADALGIPPLELAPELHKDAQFRDAEAISMTMVKDQPNRVHLKVNVITSLELASKIIALLSADAP